jgi:hypothetical protein
MKSFNGENNQREDSGVMGLQQMLDPQVKRSVEVQQDLRRGIYDDEKNLTIRPKREPRRRAR